MVIIREQIPGFEPTLPDGLAEPVAPRTGGIKGKRKSKKDKLREAAAGIVPQPKDKPNGELTPSVSWARKASSSHRLR